MFLEKVESIQVDQGIFGRLLDFGSITISGTGGDKSPVKNVSQPLEFRKAFMTAVNAATAGRCNDRQSTFAPVS